MDPFNHGLGSQGVVCGCVKELRHQSIKLLGTRTSNILEIFLTLSLLYLIALKAIFKWKSRDHCPYSVASSKNRDGQLNTHIERSIGTLGWKPIHVSCALVHRGFGILLQILFRFPLQPERINEWFTVTVPRAEEESRDLNVMNVDKTAESTNKIYNMQDNTAFPDSLSEGNHTVLFHGTNHDGALSIINDGINLELGREKLDFSNGDGFYLNNKLDKAIEWAQGRKHNPAVLIYRFSKDTLKTFKGLDHTITTEEEAKKEWQKVILQFRSGNPDRKFLRRMRRNVDYIEGPMAAWPPKNKHKNEHLRVIPDCYQLCVRSAKLANAFDRSLHSALFLLKQD